MTAALQPTKVTYEEYVAAEDAADFKSEWINGVIYAMSGGTIPHARLAMAVGRVLGNQLLGKRCAVFSSDLRVRSMLTDFASYPDLSVVCGAAETHAKDKHACINPTVVVEVLSPSTETFDRGDKAAHYRRMTSIQAYVLVATSERRIEVFTRQPDGRFVLSEAGPGESVQIAPISCTLVVDEIYADPLAEPPAELPADATAA